MDMREHSEAAELAPPIGGLLDRRALLEGAGVIARALGMGAMVSAVPAAAASALDAKAEAKRIAFDRTGSGETVLLISGFPQTRRSWNKIVPVLSKDFRTVAAGPAELRRFRSPLSPGDHRKCRENFSRIRLGPRHAVARGGARLRRLGRL
jgi:hypothetical protein